MIEKAWQDYEWKVIPPTAPVVQRVESKRAFYAGAAALLDGLTEKLEDGKEPTLKDLKLIHDVFGELTSFYQKVKAGEA